MSLPLSPSPEGRLHIRDLTQQHRRESATSVHSPTVFGPDANGAHPLRYARLDSSRIRQHYPAQLAERLDPPRQTCVLTGGAPVGYHRKDDDTRNVAARTATATALLAVVAA